MTVIGLTGPTGSGKTTLCAVASSMGFKIINADEVYHSLLLPPSECLDEIASSFGAEILTDEGTLDRKRLSRIVFADKEKLSVLNQITHKYVKNEFAHIISKMSAEGVEAIIVDAPTLFESGFDKKCDFTVSLLATEELRRSRIIARDGLTQENAALRLSAQKDDGFFISRSDYIIYNNGSEELLKEEFLKITDTARRKG